MSRNSTIRENQTLVLALLRSAQLFHRRMNPVFKAAGLTSSQWDVLETLNTKGNLSVNQLMTLTLGTSGNLDIVIKNLVQLELVEKAIDQHDRRARTVRLTSKGTKKVAEFMPLHNRELDRIFTQLSSTQKRRTISSLNQLRKSLTQTS